MGVFPDDEQNVVLATNHSQVDSLNQEFYSRFPYPGPAEIFPRLEDRMFETVMLNQSLGNWKGDTVCANAEIWVAGCGTNQALLTALRFPDASIIGSDLSAVSLELCEDLRRKMDISNLSLFQESLNASRYESRFDYILCTGVLHHNSNPEEALRNITRALKPGGILELMVYNRFHRLKRAAFQKAVRLIRRDAAAGSDFQTELQLAKLIIEHLPNGIAPLGTLEMNNSPDAQIADALIQPVEYSYTVESLAQLATSAGLECILPCYNTHDKVEGRTSWNLRVNNPSLQRQLDSLPDLARWQVTNLLLFRDSPSLWFYLQKASDGRRSSEKWFEWHVCEEFLDRGFVPARTRVRNYRRRDLYELSAAAAPYPHPPGGLARAVVERATAKKKMREILMDIGIDVSERTVVNEIRIQTTTTVCPYLRAVA